MKSFESHLQGVLDERQRLARYRQRRTVEVLHGIRTRVAGRDCLNFCSNDYLGLAQNPALVAAFQQAAKEFGVGSGASHLVSGHSREHHQLEMELAEFTGRERALVFSTGYMANLGIINALLGKGDTVVEDRLNHASLLDGGLSCGARFRRYRHKEVLDAQKCLESAEEGRVLLVTDGVFSMDGDLAPLPVLAETAAASKAWLMVDDAHGIGVLGAEGRGICEHFGLGQQQVPVLMATFGKALGSFGAFVAGSHLLIEALIQLARPYIYTTALPPAVAAATRASLRLVQDEGWRRQKLSGLIALFKQRCREEALELLPSDTPIQALVVGSDGRALAYSQTLLEQGYWISAIRPPTVPEGTARLRITFSAGHEESQVEALVQALLKARDQVDQA